MSKEIDRTRHKTGINKLDVEERKKLFHDFVEHGGEVVQEKPSRRGKVPRKPIQRPDGIKQKKEEASTGTPAPYRTDAAEKLRAPESAKKPSASAKKPRTKLFHIVRIYIKGLANRVFTLKGDQLRDQFIDYFQKETKEHLLNISTALSPVIKEFSLKNEMLGHSVGENAPFYEFVLRMHSIYDEKEFDTISGIISKKKIPEKKHLDVFKIFFKKMYILGKHLPSCNFYLEKVLELQQKHHKINQKIVPSYKQNLKTDIQAVIEDLMPRFQLILCRMAGMYYPLYSQGLDDLLGITERDEIGYITRNERKKRLEELKKLQSRVQEKTKQEAKKQEEPVKAPRHINKGMPLVNNLLNSFEKTNPNYETNQFLIIDRNDKMYKTEILLEIFENEYSFILTTGKISFSIDYREQKKIDIKEDLSHSYYIFSEAREEANNYLDLIKEIRNTEGNSRLTVHQRSVILESLSKKRSSLNRTVRRKIAEVMKNIEQTLSVIITDYNSQDHLLENPNQPLYFNKNIDGIKRLDGKRVIEAIVEAFLFTSTFAFMLNFGELSGTSVFLEEQLEQQQPSTD